MGLLRRKRAKAEAEPKAKPRRRFRLVSWLATLLLWSFIGMAGLFIYAWASLGGDHIFSVPEREPGILLLASDGKPLAERGAFLGDEVRIDELPDYVPDAIIAIEDRRFRSHFGLDPIGLGRAIWVNLKAGRVVEGGSTLTQQLAKNLFLKQERTYGRKLQEMVLALWLEARYSKDEILQLYLNRVYFGGGAVGIEKAAQKFFGHSARELTLSEAASLAAVLKAPTRLNPQADAKANAARAAEVIKDMLEEGFINEMEAKIALLSPATARKPEGVSANQYIVDWVMDQLPDLIGKFDQSIIVETTIDRQIQVAAERAVRNRVGKEGAKLALSQAAAIVLDARGEVRAMVGGRSYVKSQFNRITQARRQPGSAFKPFVYLTAMEQGLNPMSTEVDAPIRIGNWQPENYKKQYLGEVSLTEALAQSINTVAVRLALRVGPENVVATARRLGIASELEANASLALGTSSITALELASAYAPFANGGYGVVPHVVKRITTRDGTLLYERRGSGIGQVVSPAAVGAMNFMLREVVARGTGTAAAIPGIDMAGKTGTTQDYRDAWFIGYSANYICAVWTGNDDNSPMKRVAGGGLPATIWKDIMLKAHEGLPYKPLPGEAPVPQPQIGVPPAIADFFGAFRDALENLGNINQ